MNYQPLFDHLSKEHGLTLHISEMQEIVRIVLQVTYNNETCSFSGSCMWKSIGTVPYCKNSMECSFKKVLTKK